MENSNELRSCQMREGNKERGSGRWENSCCGLGKDWEASRRNEAELKNQHCGLVNQLQREPDEHQRMLLASLLKQRNASENGSVREIAKLQQERKDLVKQCNTLMQDREGYKLIISKALKVTKGLETEVEEGLKREEELMADLEGVRARLTLLQSEIEHRVKNHAHILHRRECKLAALRFHCLLESDRVDREKRQKVQETEVPSSVPSTAGPSTAGIQLMGVGLGDGVRHIASRSS